MTRHYLLTEIRISGKTVPFISFGLIILNGCHECGKYREESQKIQAIYLDFFDDKFLCYDCLDGNNQLDSVNKDMTIRVVDSSLLIKKYDEYSL